jgi:hypothetical protein
MPSSVKRHLNSQHVRSHAPLPSPLDIPRCLWGLRPKYPPSQRRAFLSAVGSLVVVTPRMGCWVVAGSFGSGPRPRWWRVGVPPMGAGSFLRVDLNPESENLDFLRFKTISLLQKKGLFDMRFFDVLHSKHACLKQNACQHHGKNLACLIVIMHVDIFKC